MNFIYNILINLVGFTIKIIAFFNTRIRLFVKGRKTIYNVLAQKIKPGDKVIWFHAASLGEFEQGLPVIEKVKKLFPHYKILVTFFSPSGFEVRKNHPVPDIITYLPLDSPRNAHKFIDLVKPSLAVFIKYEFWPNYLSELKKNNIPIIAIAAIFRENQIFFKPYGGLMRKAIKNIDHFFVQDKNSIALLKSIGIEKISLSGDTRFDRVASILERDNSLAFIKKFKQNKLCLVAGSTWPEDESALISYINGADTAIRFIIAPHMIKPEKVQKIKSQISRKTVLYSEMNDTNLLDSEVFIIDTIGLLTKIYSYADLAYVGGGLGKTGLHNTLEPAVFGIPVVIGTNYDKFKEARDLVNLGGIISIKNAEQLEEVVNEIIQNPKKRKATGKINYEYIKKNKGATDQIIGFIRTLMR